MKEKNSYKNGKKRRIHCYRFQNHKMKIARLFFFTQYIRYTRRFYYWTISLFFIPLVFFPLNFSLIYCWCVFFSFHFSLSSLLLPYSFTFDFDLWSLSICVHKPFAIIFLDNISRKRLMARSHVDANTYIRYPKGGYGFCHQLTDFKETKERGIEREKEKKSGNETRVLI